MTIMRQFKIWIVEEAGGPVQSRWWQPLTITDALADYGSRFLASDPPNGMCYVTNLYVDLATGKLIIEYDDIPRKGE